MCKGERKKLGCVVEGAGGGLEGVRDCGGTGKQRSKEGGVCSTDSGKPLNVAELRKHAIQAGLQKHN